MSDIVSHTPETLQSLLTSAGVPVSDAQRDRLGAYGAMLREWNARINLISRKDEEQLWRNHILHSLAVLALLPLPQRGAMLDIGTGGGMPGIPLAIMRPDVRFTLVDSIAKKTVAVQDMATRLALVNVTVLRGRVEDEEVLDACEGKMDVVLARAVTQLPSLVRWASPLLRRDGERRLIVWKGGDVADELAEARRHAAVREVREMPIDLPSEQYFLQEEKKLIEVRFA